MAPSLQAGSPLDCYLLDLEAVSIVGHSSAKALAECYMGAGKLTGR